MSQSPDFETLYAAVRQIATTVAAPNARDVDAKARFPEESIAALKKAKVLSAPVPKEFGGPVEPSKGRGFPWGRRGGVATD